MRPSSLPLILGVILGALQGRNCMLTPVSTIVCNWDARVHVGRLGSAIASSIGQAEREHVCLPHLPCVLGVVLGATQGGRRMLGASVSAVETRMQQMCPQCFSGTWPSLQCCSLGFCHSWQHTSWRAWPRGKHGLVILGIVLYEVSEGSDTLYTGVAQNMPVVQQTSNCSLLSPHLSYFCLFAPC